MQRHSDSSKFSPTRRQFTFGAALAGAALVLPRYASDASALQGSDLASLNLPTLDITVTADGFEGVPSTTAAGRYLLNVTVAEGVEQGIAAFVQPPPGMSAEEFMAAVGMGQGMPSPVASGGEEGGEEGALPTFVYQAKFAGGAGAEAGSTGSAVLDLTEGEWFAWGDDPESPQKPVIFTVTGEFPADAAEPSADVNATLLEFAIMVDGSLAAGDHILKVENVGAQPHFFELEKVPDGTTNDQIAALLEAEMTGTPVSGGPNPETDFQFAAFTPTQSIGTKTWHSLSLEAGTYVAICFFPTAGTGLPHAANGMHTVFEVTA